MVILLLFLVPRLIADWETLSTQAPALIERNILRPLDQYVSMDPVRNALREGITVQRSTMFAYLRNAATVMASVIAVFFMVAYMLMDANRLRNLILLFYPAEVRAERRRTLNRMARRMSS